MYTKLSETDGDLQVNIDRDRNEADIIVDSLIKEPKGFMMAYKNSKSTVLYLICFSKVS